MNTAFLALASTALFASVTCNAADCGATPAPSETIDTRISDLGVSPYEPLYFIAGGDGGFNAKFQLSFIYRLFREGGWFANCLRAPTHIFLSYSQTSLWDLNQRSSPFKDSSYRPRLFYLHEGNIPERG